MASGDLVLCRYLVSEFREERRLFDQRVLDLGVGVFGVDKFPTVSEDTPLVEVLEVLSRYGVSSVPILRKPCAASTGAATDHVFAPLPEATNGKRDGAQPPPGCVLLDIYCRSYVTYLTKIRPTSIIAVLNSPVGEVLRSRDPEWLAFSARCGENLHTCRKEDSLHAVFTTFAASQVHRLVCVDSYDRCEGIISIEDIWKWLF